MVLQIPKLSSSVCLQQHWYLYSCRRNCSTVALFFKNLYHYSAQLSGTEDKPCCMMTRKEKMHTYNVTALIVHGLKRGSPRQEVGWRIGMKFYKLTSEWKKPRERSILLSIFCGHGCDAGASCVALRIMGVMTAALLQFLLLSLFIFSLIMPDLLCHLYS
jgi:hypothetical protein